MKQIVQNYKTGDLRLLEVPVPMCGPNTVLVKNHFSLVSIGTEKSIINIGKKSLLGKAMARPEQVKRLVEKMKNEGVVSAMNQAMNRLDEPVALGYSSAGVVVEVGSNVRRFKPGQRVSCVGQGYASHAEVVAAPEIMCCELSDSVSFEEGSFGMLGAIAMHGLRCAKLTFGENVGVVGLGLLGVLTAQMLEAYGCNVIATDIDPAKVEMAKKLGLRNVRSGGAEFMEQAKRIGDGQGLDAVVLTVSTDSKEPVDQAVELCRFGGRVVLVGLADIHPNRNEMWAKEVEVIVSRAGGPGAMDAEYEQDGRDYPLEYVRWTEGRNHKEFLRLLEKKLVKVAPMITHRYAFVNAESAYAEIMSGVGGPHVAVLLEYPEKMPERAPIANAVQRQAESGEVYLGIIGSGLFGKTVLIPELKNVKGAKLSAIAVSSGVKAENAAKRFGIPTLTSNYRDILSDAGIGGVVVLTRHSSHAKMVCDALNAGKHVFVEKPLCVNLAEMEEIRNIYQKAGKILSVGYNRRFAPLSKKLKEHFGSKPGPLVVGYRVNAGYLPPDHWTHAEGEGGSRIVGEICHFVDYVQFLTGAMVEKVFAEMVSSKSEAVVLKDNVVVSLRLSDGSVAGITYSAGGDRACPRERVEVMGDGRMAILEDFRRLTTYSKGKKKEESLSGQDMGHRNELSNFVNSCCGKESPALSPAEIFNSTEAVFRIDESLQKGLPVSVLSR
ncbi:MAG: bi-domain-containing oxidoreductase [Nitrospinae bacterium]|nr:bi-domain-containing oxidoreductase [Nitrospinota bacterium]